MNGCIILYGESFRLGGQGNRNTGSDESYNEQIKAANSHISFIKYLNSKNINVDVYISSYATKFTNDLIDIYKDVLIGHDFYENLIGQGNSIIIFIPIKYYKYLQFLHFGDGHGQWAYLINNTDLKYDDLDTMLSTFHDSDSAKDFNPIYYIVNRKETLIHRNIGEIFNKITF